MNGLCSSRFPREHGRRALSLATAQLSSARYGRRSQSRRESLLLFTRPPGRHEVVVDKYRWSGFHETPLDLILRTEGIQLLTVCGFVTDACLLTTVFDAFARNYDIVLVKDACAATNSGAHRPAVLNMANWVYGIELLDAEEMVRKLAGEPHTSWVSTAPDQLAFASHRLDEAYEALSAGAVEDGFND